MDTFLPVLQSCLILKILLYTNYYVMNMILSERSYLNRSTNTLQSSAMASLHVFNFSYQENMCNRVCKDSDSDGDRRSENQSRFEIKHIILFVLLFPIVFVYAYEFNIFHVASFDVLQNMVCKQTKRIKKLQIKCE